VRRAVDKPIIDDGSDIATIRSKDPVSFDTPNDSARAAVDLVSRYLKGSAVLGIEAHFLLLVDVKRKLSGGYDRFRTDHDSVRSRVSLIRNLQFGRQTARHGCDGVEPGA